LWFQPRGERNFIGGGGVEFVVDERIVGVLKSNVLIELQVDTKRKRST